MNITVRKSKKRLLAIEMGFRSSLEKSVAEMLDYFKIKWKYEDKSLVYKQIVTHKNVECRCCGGTEILQHRKYLTDFYLPNTKQILEVKGHFPMADRKKMLAIREANPYSNIIMVFSKPKIKISKTSKLTYATWCDQNNLPWVSFRELKFTKCRAFIK